ncbi:MAG: protease-4 [bacterium]|jgi:protease-4
MTNFTDTDSPTRLLHELARESLVERRRARRWSIFFRSLTLLLIGGVVFALLRGSGGAGLGTQSGESSGGHTAMIRIEGVIGPDSSASIEPVRRALERAFADKNTRGIVLQINSPGGSPVQSGLVHDAIIAKRTEHPDVPVHAVLGDVAASGGYYVAVAAENIYANRASIVGSIGVRLDSFGAVDAIERLGIERRLLTAGEHKGLLDPFEAVDDVAVKRLQSMLDNVHAQFIDAVKGGRGTRLDSDPELFSGLIWSGEEALDNGLVDALASTHEVARDVVGAELIIDFTDLGDPLTRLRRELGVSIGVLLKNTLRTLFGNDTNTMIY